MSDAMENVLGTVLVGGIALKATDLLIKERKKKTKRKSVSKLKKVI